MKSMTNVDLNMKVEFRCTTFDGQVCRYVSTLIDGQDWRCFQHPGPLTIKFIIGFDAVLHQHEKRTGIESCES